MVVVEEILWNIFTFYSLNGNPRDPSRLHTTSLVKFCKDIMAMEQTMTERPLTLADLHLIYTAACKHSESKRTTRTTEKADKIEFEAFLTCLIRISQKCYPSNRTEEEAMQQLLMDNILPMASRRKPVSIELLLKQSNIDAIFRYYEEALRELYKFYTISSALNSKGKALQRSVKSTSHTFDDQRLEHEETRAKSREESAEHQMSYADFIRFSNDFGLVTSLSITTMDLGDIYLTVTFFNNFTPRVRKIDFREFWEAMVRCALVAFQDKKSLTSEIKIKALFLSIWRHIQSSVSDHMSGYGTLQGGGFNTYKGALLRGTQLLNEKFVAAWTKDNYSDYLAPLVLPSPQGTPSPKKSSHHHHHQQQQQRLTESSSYLDTSTHHHQQQQQHQNRTGSAITKILRAQEDMSRQKGRERGDSVSGGGGGGATGVRPRGSLDSSSMDLGRSASLDALTEDKLLKVGVDNIAMCDSYLVPAPTPLFLTPEQRAKLQPGYIRIKIADFDTFDDPRLKVPELRQLFHHKPQIAELLFDAMVEAALVSEQRVLPYQLGSTDTAMTQMSTMSTPVVRTRLSSLPEDRPESEIDSDQVHQLARNITSERPFSSSTANFQMGSTEDDADIDEDDGQALRIDDLDDELLR